MSNKELLKTINRIATNFSNNKTNDLIISNESLNIVKGHPQFLNVFHEVTFVSYLLLFFKYLTILFYKILISLIIFRPKIYNKEINSEILIISHLVDTNKNQSLSKDFYFSEFEKNRNLIKKKRFKIFLNHTRFFKNGFQGRNVIIVQNYTSFVVSILIFFRLLNQFLKCFIFSLNFKNKNSNFMRIIALEFLNPKTFRNLVVNQNLKLLINKAKIKKIFLTFEGYAWERLLCKIVKQNNHETKIIAYQFAGLTKYQNSIFQKIHKDYLPHVILTAGKINLNILRNKYSKVHVIGSSRNISIKKKISLKKKNKKLKCLVLPEGMDTECKNLINFSIRCAKKNPNISFVIRFHPMTNVPRLLSSVGLNNIVENLSNVKISKKSLVNDIKNTTICFYRGSTSAITAAQSGVFPFYIDLNKGLNIDPMYKMGNFINYFKTSEEFNRFMMNKKIFNLKYKKKMGKIKKFAEEYFEKFNQKKLTYILNLK